MRKIGKMMVLGTLTAILATAFAMKANATTETCTLDPNGTCKCVEVIQNNQIIGYKCVTGSADAKCVCPSNPA